MPCWLNRRGPSPRRSPPTLSRGGTSIGSRWLVPLLVGCGIPVLAGCQVLATEETTGITPFRGSGSSLTDVGERVIEGLVRGDRDC